MSTINPRGILGPSDGAIGGLDQTTATPSELNRMASSLRTQPWGELTVTQEPPTYMKPDPRMAPAKVSDESVLKQLQRYMPFVMVKNGLRAAAGQEAASLTDRVHKVEFNIEGNEPSMSQELILRIWWDISDPEDTKPIEAATHEDQFIVVEKRHLLGFMSTHGPIEVLERMTTFTPDEVLRFAALL